ncbi:LytTR family DNA-binding domain-containing protein [Brevundimonas poindexterae]|uniref:LytTR family DNA-binding domain-containing protein n=1 Tax=Brevundimonas poindexterae TaxID=74325 RepID=UPI001CFCA9DA|nr:LytTR family DNA-binding domain-containing protein [Brevundimonas poindexterae]
MASPPPFTALDRPRIWLAELATCAGIGVVLGFIGPFGTFSNDILPVRIVYWTMVLLISGVVFGLALRWAWPRASRAGLRPWVWAPALVMIVTLVPAAASRVIAVGLWPGVDSSVGLLEWYGQALLVGGVYVLGYVLLRTREGPSDSPSGDAPEPNEHLNRDVLCLQMEDHYVRIHTVQGSALALMSLSQAIKRLDGIEGLQTHRSWWVARSAVIGVVEDGRNLRLSLVGGLTAPVSRARVSQLRAAGWI